jgi:hypothetical protein
VNLLNLLNLLNRLNPLNPVNPIRRRLHSWALGWLIFQAASLSALVPVDCCASHRPATTAAQPTCHESGATPRDQCSLRNGCRGPLLRLAVLLPQQGIPVEPIIVAPVLTLERTVNSATPAIVGNPHPPGTPPPRG